MKNYLFCTNICFTLNLRTISATERILHDVIFKVGVHQAQIHGQGKCQKIIWLHWLPTASTRQYNLTPSLIEEDVGWE